MRREWREGGFHGGLDIWGNGEMERRRGVVEWLDGGEMI